ncbi:QueT transporter family protein [Sporanaerobium hydrogeniformans]|uniref:QueT transporter family protein n=1 Tax=Sporanaerobium hydrogeniformans TaxID=3072179 RepID=UPI0015D4701D|nr:QueT transporter family protein [Sporanaerobium hydrogeniformans]
MKMTTQRIVKTAAIAAIYVALTLAFAFMSYGNIQFRLSEVMTLFAFFDPFYIPGLTLGCLIANLLGPNGILDAVVGTIATLISVILIALTGVKMRQSRVGIWIASIWPTLINAVMIGIMLNKLFELPLALTMLEVGIGEFVVITLAGVPLFKFLMKKHAILFDKLIKEKR